MRIINFKQVNNKLPDGSPCMIVSEGKMKCIVTCWRPSNEDIERIKKGEPIFIQMYNTMPPTVVYTLKEDGTPNI